MSLLRQLLWGVTEALRQLPDILTESIIVSGRTGIEDGRRGKGHPSGQILHLSKKPVKRKRLDLRRQSGKHQLTGGTGQHESRTAHLNPRLPEPLAVCLPAFLISCPPCAGATAAQHNARMERLCQESSGLDRLIR